MFKTYVAFTPDQLLTAYGPPCKDRNVALRRLRRLAAVAHEVDLRDLSKPYSRSLIACAKAGRLIGVL